MNSDNGQDVLRLNNWYNNYYTPLVLWADTIVHNIAIAEDIVQELFTYLYEKDRYKSLGEEKIKSYLYVSVRNMALRSLHVHRNIQNLPDISIVERVWDDVDHSHDELIEKMGEAMGKLPPRSRDVLECVYLKDMRYAEVAKHLGISIATVKTLLVRSLKKLRNHLDKGILFLFYRLACIKEY
jgi:RNA polymerase sigma-70 factor (ECF subfamily)